MLQRFVLGVCVGGAVAGCSGDSLEDFSQRTLAIQVVKKVGQERYLFSASLVLTEEEAGCPSLDSGVEATLNGERMELYRGGWASDTGGPPGEQVGGPCAPPTAALWVDAARFQGGADGDALVELRDGDRRMVAGFRNYFGRHALARGEQPLPVKPGQEVFLPWSPATDDLSQVDTVLLDNITLLNAKPEAGGLRVTFPEGLPAGPAAVHAVEFYRVPQVRCEGVAACVALRPTALYTEALLDIEVQP